MLLSCLALAVFGLRMLQPSKTERFVAFITTHHLITDNMSEPCRDALRLMLSDSALANKWQVNGPLWKDGVNLYLVGWQRDGNTVAIPEELRSYRGTLAYLGEDNAIAIDADYALSLIVRLGLAPYIENPFARKRAEAQTQREFM